MIVIINVQIKNVFDSTRAASKTDVAFWT